MNLVKIKKFNEKHIKGRFAEFVMIGMSLNVKINGQRLTHIEDGLAEILMAC